MGGNYFMIIDIITIIGGLFCIFFPDKAYNFGRKEKLEVPAKWPVTSRIVGAVLIAVGGLFLYLGQS